MNDIEISCLIVLAALTGAVIGALARQPKLRQLAEEKAALIEQCGEFFDATVYLQRINQQLGRAMEAAGLDVQRIGECECGECDEEWPESLEEVSR